MKRELEHNIIKLCPLLYRDRYGDPNTTAMYWGVAVGSGWYKIVLDLSLKIEREIVKQIKKNSGGILPEDYPRAAQVKEKFGVLRFHMTSATPSMFKLIGEAEYLSSITCEACGSDGGDLRDNRGGWLQTLCDKCYEKKETNGMSGWQILKNPAI